MRLTLEIEGRPGEVTLPGDGAGLVAFLSFAVSRGFGAQHPLIALADRLHDQFHVSFGPLTTFYDAVAEDAEDRRKLELAWQDPKRLREAFETSVCAIKTDEQCQALVKRAAIGDIAGEVEALLGPLRSAEAENARVRMVYAL